MIDDLNINIKKLVDTHRRGDNITVREKKEFKYDIASLRNATSRLVDGKVVKLTSDQYCFVKTLLGFCITSEIPRLERILAAFDLSLDDTLYTDEECEMHF